MLKDRNRSLAGIPKRIFVTAAMMFIVSLTAASSALAVRPFEKFAQCPTEIPVVRDCLAGLTTSGEIAIGNTRMLITQPITIQGAMISTNNPERPTQSFLIPAKNGESLSKTEMNVPGGLFRVANCSQIRGRDFFRRGARKQCERAFGNRLTRVTATPEPVANEHNPALLDSRSLNEEEGTALTLPLRIHLKNPFLGQGCYIGSESNPIELHLSTGTSGTIKGKRGMASTVSETLEGQEEPILSLHLSENSLVDNTFTVPVAEGCGEFFGFTGFLDSIVNQKFGLPSGAGSNIAKLEGELNETSPEELLRSGF